MASSLDQLKQRYQALTVREQRMVIAAILLVLWGSVDHFAYQPLAKQQKAVQAEITNLQNSLNAQQAAVTQLQALGENAPKSPLRVQVEEMQKAIDAQKSRLAASGKKFVGAEAMASALRDVLNQQGNLTLVRAETLPVSGFGSEEKQPTWVYRHALAITVQGDYFSTLNYLKSLEALSWRIQWDSIEYQVKEYPIAETRIQVYTLSFDKDWLGV